MNIEEYKTLRDEILSHFQNTNRYNIITIVATGAILSIAFSTEKPSPFLFLAPLIVIIPNAFNYAFHSEAITRIGTYIQVFGEQETTDFRWQTRLYHIVPQFGIWSFRGFLIRFLYTFNFLGLSLVCIALFLIHGSESRLLDVSICIVGIILVGIAEYRILNVLSLRVKYLNAWRDLLDKENK